MSYMSTKRQSVVYIFILVLLACALWMPRLKGPLDLRYDAGVYYILGKSLAAGKGYRLLNEPGEIKAIQYPPLLPLIAAGAIYLAQSANPYIAGHWLRLFFVAIFIAYIIVTYLLSRLYLSPNFAFFASLITLVNIQTVWLSDLFFAELPFSFVSSLFLFLLEKKGGQSKEWVMAILGSLAYLLRTVGVALLAAWVGESLLKKDFRRTAIRIALVCIPVLAWQGYIAGVKTSSNYRHPAYEYQRAGYQFYNVGYLDNIGFVDPYVPEKGKLSLQFLVKRIAQNIVAMPIYLGKVLTSKVGWVKKKVENINISLWSIVILLWLVDTWLVFIGFGTLCGMVLLAIKRTWSIPLYVASTIVLISITPWPGEFQRYLMPLIPLLSIGLLLAITTLWQYLSKLNRWYIRYAGAIGIIAMLCCVFSLEAFPLYKVCYGHPFKVRYEDDHGRKHKYRLLLYSAAWKQYDAAIDWLRSKARPGDIVVTSIPHWVYLRAGLQAIMPPFEPDVRKAECLVGSASARYLIVDNLESTDIIKRYAEPMVSAYPRDWAMVYCSADGRSRIYRRVKGAAKLLHPCIAASLN